MSSRSTIGPKDTTPTLSIQSSSGGGTATSDTSITSATGITSADSPEPATAHGDHDTERDLLTAARPASAAPAIAERRGTSPASVPPQELTLPVPTLTAANSLGPSTRSPQVQRSIAASEVATAIRQDAATLPTVIEVSTETQRLLQVGDLAIRWTRERVLVGNQLTTYRESRGQAWAAQRRTRAIAELNAPRYTEANATLHPAMKAAESLQGGGGHCGEIANVVYNYLLSNTTGLMINRAKIVSAMDHGFVFIGDPHGDPSTWVVVDAWPVRPRACRWSEYFCTSTDPRTAILVKESRESDGVDRLSQAREQLDLTVPDVARPSMAQVIAVTRRWRQQPIRGEYDIQRATLECLGDVVYVARS